ncbi:STS14 protein-like [Senna tora]|uniref:STS14 protein-like n=1 Tax=Senna tora TaxID=362788 RepID=A0A834TV91_9FABA|nr:STS14 protein-like [Senna tora]
MGTCASSQNSKTTESHTGKGKGQGQGKGGGIRGGVAESFRRPSTIMVIDLEGGIKEFRHPLPASSIVSDNPNCFLCNSESIYLGTCLPRVPDDEQLRPGHSNADILTVSVSVHAILTMQPLDN